MPHFRYLEDLNQIALQNADKTMLDKIRDKVVANPLLKTTAITLTAIYYQMRMGLPLSAHDVIMDLLRRFNVITGPNYCVGEYAARNMLMSIANNMQNRLIAHLQSSSAPVTLSLDG